MEIYFRDLNKDAQKRFLKEMGLKSEKEGNYDVFPISEVQSSYNDEIDLDRICEDYNVEKSEIEGMTIDEICDYLGEEEGALDIYLFNCAIAKEPFDNLCDYVWNGNKGVPFGFITDEKNNKEEILDCVGSFVDGFVYDGEDYDMSYNPKNKEVTCKFSDNSILKITLEENNKGLSLKDFSFGNECKSFKEVSEENKKSKKEKGR